MKKTTLEIWPAKDCPVSIQVRSNVGGAVYVNGVLCDAETDVPIEEEKPQTKTLRRYEIILPLFFNDNTEISGTLMDLTLDELEREFGGVSHELNRIIGFWKDEVGFRYQEQNTRIFCDVPNEPDSKDFFREYKETLKTRFKQQDIWMVSYLIDMV
ncbi:hypothetical protein LCGC14_1266900 [marine sediment metagenome]|uniref:Uncharacterized protein n=1 Tax=marine sediment metagenome TaxID=412755 RepID=A0A0F9P2D8_9ZZZZ